MARRLKNDEELESSDIVANGRMNREREITRTNSYAADLGFALLDFLTERLENQSSVAWLDLCCGSARALIQAAQHFHAAGLGERVRIDGVDLVGMFQPRAGHLTELHLHTASITTWEPGRNYDLITCVHGLHYIGDQLTLIARAASWLNDSGRFIGHLDLANITFDDGKSSPNRLGRQFSDWGFRYDSRRHLLSRTGGGNVHFPYAFLGSDDTAGPNFTGQPAVDSHYTTESPRGRHR